MTAAAVRRLGCILLAAVNASCKMGTIGWMSRRPDLSVSYLSKKRVGQPPRRRGRAASSSASGSAGSAMHDCASPMA